MATGLQFPAGARPAAYAAHGPASVHLSQVLRHLIVNEVIMCSADSKQAEAASGCEQQQKQQQDSGFGSFSIAYAIGSLCNRQPMP
jgi:hypothetical protein